MIVVGFACMITEASVVTDTAVLEMGQEIDLESRSIRTQLSMPDSGEWVTFDLAFRNTAIIECFTDECPPNTELEVTGIVSPRNIYSVDPQAIRPDKPLIMNGIPTEGIRGPAGLSNGHSIVNLEMYTISCKAE